MPTPPDPIIPTATADQPGEARPGDYLAPPAARMPLSRSLPILLLCGTLLINGRLLLYLIQELSVPSIASPAGAALSAGLLIVQFFAIFRSHKWPTWALWLALGAVLGGLYLLVWR
ncbi:MAG TPA: hypothetical protein VD886_19995 [Herpetosiphonaceae bacterium]|nr:hypothetical protein [Herpetosiphonaceae bacterium]